MYVRKIKMSIRAMLKTTTFLKKIPKLNFLRAVKIVS